MCCSFISLTFFFQQEEIIAASEFPISNCNARSHFKLIPDIAEVSNKYTLRELKNQYGENQKHY